MRVVTRNLRLALSVWNRTVRALIFNSLPMSASVRPAAAQPRIAVSRGLNNPATAAERARAQPLAAVKRFGYQLQKNAPMMFPAQDKDLIRMAFTMSGATPVA